MRASIESSKDIIFISIPGSTAPVLCQLSYTPDKFRIPKSAFRNSKKWLRGRDLNPRPLGYEPNELPDCSTPR